MSFCSNCGSEIVDGAKFCVKCGCSTPSNILGSGNRQHEFAGKVYKCPGCGAELHSFVSNCPSCGLELRGTKVVSAVREFSLKLEAIEARRVDDKPKGLFAASAALQHISKTDEQKISLIQSFSVPNTKEDILEFMILATSNVNLRTLSTMDSTSKGENALNDAWISKIQQVYKKAKIVYGNESGFDRIQELYDKCNLDIKKAKKNKTLKYALLFGFAFGWIPIGIIVLLIVKTVNGPVERQKEITRLEAIEQEAYDALEDGEYKKALLNAEGLEYKPQYHDREDDEIDRQWKIKKELLIDKILDEAEKNGVELEYTPQESDDSEEQSKIEPGGGFVEGFKRGLRRGFEEGSSSDF